jgi:hypothetical protein
VSGYKIEANAEVNPYCYEDITDTTLGSTATSSLTYLNLSASASAEGFEVMTSASVIDGSGGELSSGNGLGQEVFSILGNPNKLALPLTFTIGFTGSVLLQTTPGDRGSAADGSFDMTIYAGSDIGQTVQDPGSVSLESVGGGTPTTSVSGFAAAPVVPPNGSVNISGAVSIDEPTSQSGYLEIYLDGEAEAPGGTAQDWFNAQLLSVTVPDNFTAIDISQLSVSLADGSDIPVTFAAPEPGTCCLFLLALASLPPLLRSTARG